MNSQSRQKQRVSKKVPSSAWKPGQSGNPGGRPKVAAEVRDLARQHGHEAIQRLVGLMHSSNEGVAVRACEALLDRGYGRPLLGLDVNCVDVTPQRWHVEIVPMPICEDTAPSYGSLPSNGIAQLTYGSRDPSAGRIIA